MTFWDIRNRPIDQPSRGLQPRWIWDGSLKWSALSRKGPDPLKQWNALNIGLILHGWYKPKEGQTQSRPSHFGLDCQTRRGTKGSITRAKYLAHSFKWRMSSINIDIHNENASSEESSVKIQVIPGNQETESPSSDSNSEASVDSNERQRTCVIKIQVETPLPGKRSRSINQAKGVTVRILQSNLHRVRIYTPCQTTNLGWSWSSNVRDVM